MWGPQAATRESMHYDALPEMRIYKDPSSLSESMGTTLGILGHGRIGSAILDRASAADDIEVDYVYELPEFAPDDLDVPVITDTSDLVGREVDLTLESTTFQVVEELGAELLATNDVMFLSITALADPDVLHRLEQACTAHQTRMYLPHGAVLGMDGLQDARELLQGVQIETRKNPANLDFTFTDRWEEQDIEDETLLYEGPVRALCQQFPRNVNVHAIVALAGIGFDETRSRLIADPALDVAVHQIEASGGGTRLEIGRTTPIEGVTGAYTLESIWGTIRRVLSRAPGRYIV